MTTTVRQSGALSLLPPSMDGGRGGGTPPVVDVDADVDGAAAEIRGLVREYLPRAGGGVGAGGTSSRSSPIQRTAIV